MVQNFNENLKFIPRGLPRDKAMGDYQGGEAQLSPLGKSGVHTQAITHIFCLNTFDRILRLHCNSKIYVSLHT